jgi:hypothetical protein
MFGIILFISGFVERVGKSRCDFNCSLYKQGDQDMTSWYRCAFASGGALLALAGAASAADLAKGYYEIDGYVTQSSCGSILPQGSAVDTWSRYPGATVKGMQQASSATSPPGGAGDATTTVCVTGTAIPSTGLNGATLLFNCFHDTDAGDGALASQEKSTFTVGASHDPSVWQVSVNTTLIVNRKTVCTYTTDGTWTAE